MLRQLRRDEYTVGWVCALPIELEAARAMLDERHRTPQTIPQDTNIYECGRVGEHNVVIASLPAGQMGTNSAAVVATQMRLAFTSTRFGLMVGIGGGVPSKKADIRLGDVVVSKPHNVHGGVVQYDFGKTTQSGFGRTGSLDKPPDILLSAVEQVRAKNLNREGLLEYLSNFDRMPCFRRDAAGRDILFRAEYDHEGEENTCDNCNEDYAIARQKRRQKVVVHYGTIASGNQVMRDAAQRDRVSADLGGVLCFEMEAAGLMNHFQCLVIRGICDYADSHKNKKWQPYAAATAAAYAKEVLSVIQPSDEPTREARAILATPSSSIQTFAAPYHGPTNSRNNFSGNIRGGVVHVTIGGNSTAKRYRDEDSPACRPKRVKSSRYTSRNQGPHNFHEDDPYDSGDSSDDTTVSENSEEDNSDDEDESCSEESIGDNEEDSEEGGLESD